MKILVGISRVLVGILFVISGFIKLNDPVGFSFKLEEYFSPGVLNMDFFTPYALAIAIVIVIFETVLGVMLLLGYKPKFTVWSLLLMILFFTFLTFYSAYYNKVTDCGCFGDAVKLTPWESFSKDVVLLVLILILFFGYKHIKPLISAKVAMAGTSLSLIACMAFAYHVYNHLPVIDFRAYKIGTNIMEGMMVPENAPQAIYEYAWRFKVNGEDKIIKTTGDYPSVEGEFVDVETKEIQKGYEPPIHDFTMEMEGEDYTGTIMEWEHVIVVVARDIAKSDEKGLLAVTEVAKIAKEMGYKVIGLSASSPEEIQPVKERLGLDIDFYFCDLTTVKTIVRSNPALLELEKGTIKQKLHFNDAHQLKLYDVKPAMNVALKEELERIQALDQGIREIYFSSGKEKKDSLARIYGIEVQENESAYMGMMHKIDSVNLVSIENIIAKYGYPGKSLVGEPANKAAWLVIQHSNKIPQYLNIIKKSGDEGELDKKLVAMMEDRNLMYQGKPQVYGTQGSTITVKGTPFHFIWPIEDAEHVNERRTKIGYDESVEDYAKGLFGDDFEYKTFTVDEIYAMEDKH